MLRAEPTCFRCVSLLSLCLPVVSLSFLCAYLSCLSACLPVSCSLVPLVLFFFSSFLSPRNTYCVVLVDREKVGETVTALKTLSPVKYGNVS